ncbi:efflux RND transporter periplasmic adaptor subunit [Croceicoccus naphthovorans]|uniref:Secretion protein HylD n=1 Tax=Croceicoccus naphthovorans TaxID=1348774 RepID=A0A0G3XHZ1_9SPHN|nr:efflux RND transporter periplasmic adaptor subunit [Croceicoccus naphthovorans]AKM11160.1 secretion protein HylD [Croceicoccus naphthovorans]MBB3989955.1 RND family efflux transporter MFP subunit [Croceicoccus naphthovorans]
MNYETSPETRRPDVAEGEVVIDEFAMEEAEDRRRRQIKIALIAAAAIVGIVAIVLFFTGSGEAVADDPAATQVPTVSVIVPGSSSVVSEINASGTLAARKPMPIGSVGEGGQIVDIRVDEGDWVSQGQVLAVIDRSVQSQQASAQAAQVQVARADAQLAQSNLDRALQLVDRGFISKADVDRLTATRDAAVARVRVAESQLRELNARNARLNIVAPAGGLVLTRNVEMGQVVSGGSGPLFTLARGGEMELAALVGESDLSRLSVGATAEVSPVGSGKVFTGQVWQISPTIDETSRQGEARIALAYDRALRPGGFATARLSSGGVTAPMLPESAIQNDDDGAFVYIVTKDNTVQRRSIRTGLVTDRGITIVDGLTGKERVVLRAGGFLFEGDKIKPQMVKDTLGGGANKGGRR